MSLSRIGIVSTSQTQLRPAWDSAQHIDLISAVVTDVFKGTGLTLADVDFVIDSGSDVLDGRSISNCGFLGAMGAHHKEESRVEEDGLWSAQYGAVKIGGGSARVGLIIAYSKCSEADVRQFYTTQVDPFYQRPVGFGHEEASGLQAQRYLAAGGASLEDLADLTVQRWKDAAAQGRVQIDEVPDRDAVLNSGNLARPLTGMMAARPCDGAVAVLIANEEITNRTASRPVWLTGMGSSSESHSFATRSPDALDGCVAAAEQAYRHAGWRGADADVAEVSASTAVTELMALEALGLAGKGKGLKAATGGKTRVNASGGALPADPIMATGLVRLSEAARQLTHPSEFGLDAPQKAVVTGAGGVGMQTHCVMTLEV